MVNQERSKPDDSEPPEVVQFEDDVDVSEDSTSEEELEMLNSQLDQLNSVLDVLEMKNESIQAKLKELLGSVSAEDESIDESS